MGKLSAKDKKIKPKNIFWTFKECIKIALKYKRRFDWSTHDNKSYSAAIRHKWLKRCTKHMQLEYRPWTLSRCKKISRTFNSRLEWRNNDQVSYYHARVNHWIEECTKHMLICSKNISWTLELCKSEAKKYSIKSEWVKNGQNSYKAALKYNWLKKCQSHMIKSKKWTKNKRQFKKSRIE